MQEPTKHEIDAMMASSKKGGEYLDNLGKTDLAVMTENEWMGLVDAICSAFSDRMMELSASGSPPF